jgi:hypothetical protein
MRRTLRRIESKISKFWYWIRSHTYTKYHLLDLRNPIYKWGWVDTDWRMLYSCFILLEQFVEKEYGVEKLLKDFEPIEKSTGDKSGYEEQYNEWIENYNQIEENFHNEMRDLYFWWKDIKKHEKETDYHQFSKDCDKNLMRLMKIRRLLWT